MLFRLIVIAAFIPAVFLAACGDDDDDANDDGNGAPTATQPAGDDTEPTDAPTATAEPTATPEPRGDDDDGGSGETATVQVTAQDIAYSQTEFSVPAGATVGVAFANADPVTHTFTIDGLIDLTAGPNEQVNQSFVMPDETVEFHCTIHPSMTGVITVEGGGAGGAPESDDGGSAADTRY